MLVAACVLLAAALVPVLGGSLSRLARIRLRAAWAVYLALAVQVVIISILPQGAPALHDGAQVSTYLLGAWFVWANRSVPGLLIVGLGGALNLVAMAANRGVMPASRVAVAAAGRHVPSGFANSRPMTHPHLLFLGDIWSVPAWTPLHNVFSIGDVLIVIGGAVLVHMVGGSRLTRWTAPSRQELTTAVE